MTATIDSEATPRKGSPGIEAGERSFTTFDGLPLFYRAWLPAVPATKALLLFHRGHEHSGRFAEMVRALELDDVAIFAWDQRGHGRSGGERGFAENFAEVIRDMDLFARHLSRAHGIALENMIALGHSVAAVAVSAWVHDYAPPLRAIVLATPAFRVKLYVPFAISGLRGLSLVRGKAFIKSYVKAKMLTHDPLEAERYSHDPLISRQIAVNILLNLFDTSTRLLKDAGAIRTPTLLLTAGADWVVKNGPSRKFFDRLASTVKRKVHYPGFHHAIFHETRRDEPIGEVQRFILERFADDSKLPSLLQADASGYTQAEHDRLSAPLPLLNPKNASFEAQKMFLKTVGRLSQGVRVGWESGFDSGASLDHVYQNQSRGTTPLGRLIDRFYLNVIGWRGIRQRKIHLQELLSRTLRRMATQQDSIHLLDIASGPGRYLLEVLHDLKLPNVSALLRDQNEPALEMGRKLAQESGLTGVTYEKGDAFDFQSLAQIAPKPSIAIVSGLYELFPDNGRVLNSLRGLFAALNAGGYLIYTNQPWHPEVEMIARVLRNREGEPWVMRRRTQAEMDELIQFVGFKKIDMLIDEWGIFTVSLARREKSTQGD